jgi:hypothetical protein
MGKKGDDPGGPEEDTHPGHFLMDRYPGFELDGWIIQKESHVTALVEF